MKIRKLLRTNTVLYILLLLLFAAVTAKVSGRVLAAGEAVRGAAGVVSSAGAAGKVICAAADAPVCGADLRRSGHGEKKSNMLFAPMPMMVFNPRQRRCALN